MHIIKITIELLFTFAAYKNTHNLNTIPTLIIKYSGKIIVISNYLMYGVHSDVAFSNVL